MKQNFGLAENVEKIPLGNGEEVGVKSWAPGHVGVGLRLRVRVGLGLGLGLG